jgi:hypothetical protein
MSITVNPNYDLTAEACKMEYRRMNAEEFTNSIISSFGAPRPENAMSRFTLDSILDLDGVFGGSEDLFDMPGMNDGGF